MRLIDADALIADIKECIEVKDSNYEWEQVEGLKVALSCVDDAPTVQPDTTTHDSIPAETGKNYGDRTSGDCISRTQAIYVASGYCHPANISTELAKLPTVYPDIIRCKDCAYCDSDVIDVPYGITEKIWWCNKLCAETNENLIVEPDDFCSLAERREE